ncbi:MAG: AAA family ATPase [Thiohalomonadales bacterium]
MQRILILNSKGGCGKTTITTNLASYYAHEGYNTALMDFDPQGSSTQWLSVRSLEKPIIHGIVAHANTSMGQTSAFQNRVPHGTEKVILDTPAGINGEQLKKLIAQTDVVIIPVLPSPIDIHAVSRFIQELLLGAKIRHTQVRVCVIANRIKRQTNVYKSLKRFLNNLDMPFLTELRDSQNYVHAAERGLGIYEMWDSRVAKDKDEWQPMLDWLGRETHVQTTSGFIPQ